MTNLESFWNRKADAYAKQPIGDEASYQRKLEITRQYLTPQTKVLEFGCGTGGTAILHAPHVARIDAIDISRRMLEIARAKSPPENLHFSQATLASFEAEDASYDVVLGLSILHLVPDLAQTVASVHRLLKTGGKFVSSTPCLGDSMKWFKLVGPVGRALGLLPLLRVFSTAELLECLTSSGFTIESQWRPKKNAPIFVVASKD